jgi:hypothetical protein
MSRAIDLTPQAASTSQPTSALPSLTPLLPSSHLDIIGQPNLQARKKVATHTHPHNAKSWPVAMASADFAAAQARLLERRRARDAAEQVQRTHQHAAHAAATTPLPFPLRNIGDAGLSVWDAVKGREGTRPAFRVGQVDAELLDEELLELMKAQVGEALKYYGVCRSSAYRWLHLLTRRADTPSHRLRP